MIMGGRINSVEATHVPDKPMKGLSVSVGVEAVRSNGDMIEIDYFYLAGYEGGMGSIKMKGTLFAQEEKALSEKIKTEWEKSKKLPNDYSENLRNVLIHSGTANGVLLARVLDMPPPMPTFKIETQKK